MQPTQPSNLQPDIINQKGQPYEIHEDNIKVQTIAEATQRQLAPGFTYHGAGISPTYAISSLNYSNNGSGWQITSGGDAQFNGTHVVTIHFTPVFKTKGVTMYVSDLTSPNGTLSGSTGDICLNGDSGKLYVCAGTTTWYAPA